MDNCAHSITSSHSRSELGRLKAELNRLRRENSRLRAIVEKPEKDTPAAEIHASRAWELLDIKKEEFQLLTSKIPAAYWLREDGQVKFFNLSTNRIWDDDLEEYLATPGKFMELIPPEEREQVREVLGLKALIEPVDHTHRIIMPDGKLHWVWTRAFPCGEGRIMGISTDITHIKELELSRVESEAKFRAVFDNMSAGVTIFDVEGDGQKFRISDMNRAGLELSEVSREEILGRDVCEVFPGMEASGLLAVFRRVWQSNQEAQRPETKYIDDRLQMWLENYVCKLPGGQIMSVFQDRSQEVLASQRREHTQKMEALGTLAGGIAHDFNNILAAIVGYAEITLDELGPDHGSHKDIKRIMEASRRAGNLVNRILTFSQSGQSRLRSMALNRAVEESVNFLRSSLPRSITLKLSLAKDRPWVAANCRQLSQLIINLAINASEAMDNHGELEISTRVIRHENQTCPSCRKPINGKFVELAVRDNGHGMTAEVMKRIYDPFYTSKEIGQGSGLGLSVAYGIVQNHNGHICCSSNPGQGSVFRVFFPECLGKQGDIPAAPKEQVGAAILMADDEADILTIGSRFLEREGHVVITAASGNEAMDLFAEHAATIDLVVMDLNMPGLSGRQCLQMLSKYENPPKILVISGYGRNQAMLNDYNLELGFVPKPFSRAELVSAVRQLLRVT